MTASAPSGVVTFLFTDVEGSTRRWEADADAMRGVAASPWLFPSVRAGRHLCPQVIRERLEQLGIDLLGARNTTLQSLVVVAPPPLVAELLGYSYNTAQLHAEIAAQPWARYVTKTAATTSLLHLQTSDAANVTVSSQSDDLDANPCTEPTRSLRRYG